MPGLRLHESRSRAQSIGGSYISSSSSSASSFVTALESLVISPLKVAALSEHQAQQALLPPTSSRLEYQLMVSFTAIFPCFANPRGGVLAVEPILTQIPFHRQESTRTRYDRWRHCVWSALSTEPLSSPTEGPSSSPQTCSAYPATSSSKHLCDERLTDLDISFWTKSSISQEKAAQAISFFLRNEQPIAGILEADLFLRDLVAKQSRFCSPFLVSALLWWISVSGVFSHSRVVMLTIQHSYKTLDSEVKPELFVDEVMERASVSAYQHDSTTVAACLLLSLAASAAGLLEISSQYMNRVLSISTSLSWFGVYLDVDGVLDSHSADQIKADAHVSWAVFNYIT